MDDPIEILTTIEMTFNDNVTDNTVNTAEFKMMAHRYRPASSISAFLVRYSKLRTAYELEAGVKVDLRSQYKRVKFAITVEKECAYDAVFDKYDDDFLTGAVPRYATWVNFTRKLKFFKGGCIQMHLKLLLLQPHKLMRSFHPTAHLESQLLTLTVLTVVVVHTSMIRLYQIFQRQFPHQLHHQLQLLCS